MNQFLDYSLVFSFEEHNNINRIFDEIAQSLNYFKSFLKNSNLKNIKNLPYYQSFLISNNEIMSKLVDNAFEFLRKNKQIYHKIQYQYKQDQCEFDEFDQFKSIQENNQKRGTYKILDQKRKQEIIDLCRNDEKNIFLISKKYNISVKNIQRWLVNGSERKKGCGRKMKDLNMEKNLIKWINIQIESGNQDILNQKNICKKALQLSNDGVQFVASRGWFHKFSKRINLKRLTNKEYQNFKNELIKNEENITNDQQNKNFEMDQNSLFQETDYDEQEYIKLPEQQSYDMIQIKQENSLNNLLDNNYIFCD